MAPLAPRGSLEAACVTARVTFQRRLFGAQDLRVPLTDLALSLSRLFLRMLGLEGASVLRICGTISRVTSRAVRARRYSRVENPGHRTRSSFKSNVLTATESPRTNAGQQPARNSLTTSELTRRSAAFPACGGSLAIDGPVIPVLLVSKSPSRESTRQQNGLSSRST